MIANVCPKCKKEQLQIPLSRNGLDKDGKTYICGTCKMKGRK